jgi:hypothetical protein
MPYYIHVNRNVIDSNRKQHKNDPPVRFQRGISGRATYCHEVEIPGPSRVVYSGSVPLLPCGARLVIMSEVSPIVIR